MLNFIKVKNQALARPITKNLPAFVGERRLLVAVKDDSMKQAYDIFFTDFKNFMNSLPNIPAKKIVQNLFERDLIYFARDMSLMGKNGIVGSYVITSNKLAGILLDVAELNIDPDTGKTSNIDACFYITYFEFVRCTVDLFFDQLTSNKEFNNLLIKYLYYLMLKAAGSKVSFYIKQKKILQIVCAYFYYRFLVGDNHVLAKEKAFEDTTPDLMSELDHLFVNFDKYSNMKDIFKALGDCHLIDDNMNVLIIRCLNLFKPAGFYSLTSSLDYLVALAVVSKYPTSIFVNTNADVTLQTKIETILYSLFNKVKYDPKAIGMLKS